MSSFETKYNLKLPGVKRLMREAIELAESTEEYHACPLDDNLFEWHFTVRGPPSTEFEGGVYHGRIMLPTQYPMQPPNIILLTPNGRFEVNKKICLSISGYHPESWQPSWSIRTALLALIAFMPTPAAGTIGSLDYTLDERKVLARKSQSWECSTCGLIINKLSNTKNAGKPLTTEETCLIKNIALKAEDDTNRLQNNCEKIKVSGGDSAETIMTDAENILRQRVSPEIVSDIDQADSVPDILLETSIQRSNRDQVWSAIIWTIISLITLLIIRRCFFL